MNNVIPISEDALHIALAEYLRLLESMKRLNCLWWHTDNTHSSPQRAAKLSRMGMRPGVLDFQFLHHDNRVAWIELKKKRSYLNDNQRVFCQWLDTHGIPYVVITSNSSTEIAEKAELFLKQHGFIKDSR